MPNGFLVVFSDHESSFIPAVVAHRMGQDYSSFGLLFMVLADGEDSHIAFGTTLALPTIESGSGVKLKLATRCLHFFVH